MRPQIFVGSSKEGLQYIDKVKDYLEPAGDCVVWTNSFTHNRSNLDSLITKTKLSDFAVLIATCDDLTLKREDVKSTPRDNIIFEYGLFTGATGIDRAFLLAHEDAELPSDLDGITLHRFSDESNAYNSLEKVCAAIILTINAVEKKSQLGLLPSTALAVGYYYSFVKPTCEQIKDTLRIATNNSTLKIKDFQLHVIIPKTLDSSGVNDFKKVFTSTHQLDSASTVNVGQGRGYPFHFKIDPSDQDINNEIEVKIYDVPTTLNTIHEALKLYLPQDSVGPNHDLEYLQLRELHNFSKVLQHLVSANVITKSVVYVNDDIIT